MEAPEFRWLCHGDLIHTGHRGPSIKLRQKSRRTRSRFVRIPVDRGASLRYRLDNTDFGIRNNSGPRSRYTVVVVVVVVSASRSLRACIMSPLRAADCHGGREAGPQYRLDVQPYDDLPPNTRVSWPKNSKQRGRVVRYVYLHALSSRTLIARKRCSQSPLRIQLRRRISGLRARLTTGHHLLL